MQKHSTHKSASGFTLIELVIAVAIIGILTSVAVLGYNQYKVRAYDAHSKQALRDILLQCNAFWLDHDTSQVCNHATVAEVYVASDEIVLKFPAEDLPDLPGGSQGNFCASAQHDSSPNTYSIDSASLISEGGDCGGAGGSVQTASTGGSVQTASVSPERTFEGYIPEVCADGGEGLGSWVAVDSNGRLATRPRNADDTRPGQTIVHGGVCTCSFCGPGGGIYEWGGPRFGGTAPWGKGTLADNGYKLVYEGNQGTLAGNYQARGDPKDLLTYNFATGIWSLPDGRKRDSDGNWLQ